MAKKQEEKFILIYRCLLRSDAFKSVSCPARNLFFYMMDSMFDSHNGYSMDIKHVPFGPGDAEGFGMDKKTYYRALRKLIYAGIIREVSSGSHGKKAVYDLTAWKRTLFHEER